MENCEEQRDILGLPPYVFPAAMLVMGYPTEQQLRRKKPERVDMKYVVHENSYHELSAKELQDMLSSHAGGQDYQTWMKAFCERKYNSDFSREMSRSVRKYLEDLKIQHIVKEKNMIILNVTYKCKPGRRDAFLEAIRAEGIDAACRAEAGNIKYDYYRPVDGSDELLLVEKWQDAEVLAAHGKQLHLARLGEIKAEFVDDTVIEKYVV